MKILWLTNIPSPYRIDFFNKLGDHCELTVLFERRNASNRDSSWQNSHFSSFRGLFLRALPFSNDSALSLEILHYLRHLQYDMVVVTNFSSPTGALAVAYLKAKGQTYFLESDGGFPGAPGLKAYVKRLVIRGAHGYFSTSEANDSYFRAYGAEDRNLIRYPFGSVSRKDVASVPAATDIKKSARERIGVLQDRMVLAVGQFIHRKGFDVLLRSFADMPSDVALCVVGGDPSGDYTRLAALVGQSRVHFTPFKAKDELDAYYNAADLFVLPTREDIWGLVVNEALSHGLPVITTNRCIAGLEMVKPFGSGLIVPVDEPEALAVAIREILDDNELRASMQAAALQVARQWTIEKMVEAHLPHLQGMR